MIPRAAGFINSGNNQPQDFLIYEIRTLPVIKEKKIFLHRRQLLLQTKCCFCIPSLYLSIHWDVLVFRLRGHSPLPTRSQGRTEACCMLGRDVPLGQATVCVIPSGASCSVSHLTPSLLINHTMHANSLPWQFTCFRIFVPNKAVFPFPLTKVWNEDNEHGSSQKTLSHL